MHMSIGVILVILVVFAQLRFIFRDIAVLKFAEPQDVQVRTFSFVISRFLTADFYTSKLKNIEIHSNIQRKTYKMSKIRMYIQTVVARICI